MLGGPLLCFTFQIWIAQCLCRSHPHVGRRKLPPASVLFPSALHICFNPPALPSVWLKLCMGQEHEVFLSKGNWRKTWSPISARRMGYGLLVLPARKGIWFLHHQQHLCSNCCSDYSQAEIALKVGAQHILLIPILGTLDFGHLLKAKSGLFSEIVAYGVWVHDLFVWMWASSSPLLSSLSLLQLWFNSRQAAKFGNMQIIPVLS